MWKNSPLLFIVKPRNRRIFKVKTLNTSRKFFLILSHKPPLKSDETKKFKYRMQKKQYLFPKRNQKFSDLKPFSAEQKLYFGSKRPVIFGLYILLQILRFVVLLKFLTCIKKHSLQVLLASIFITIPRKIHFNFFVFLIFRVI